MGEDEIITDILASEGDRFTDDPIDRGGATKYGVTQRSWDNYCTRFFPALRGVSVEHLTEDAARKFYAAMYVRPLAWIEDIQLRALVVDSAVQHGAPRAVKWLQSAALVPPDGIVGPTTRFAVNNRDGLFFDVFGTRMEFYADILARDPTQTKWARGWFKRLRRFLP